MIQEFPGLEELIDQSTMEDEDLKIQRAYERLLDAGQAARSAKPSASLNEEFQRQFDRIFKV